MKTRSLSWFDSLSKRDFENQAVLDEIRAVFKERDRLHAELNTPGPPESKRAAIARLHKDGGHWG
jgi:hypothetical protein